MRISTYRRVRFDGSKSAPTPRRRCVSWPHLRTSTGGGKVHGGTVMRWIDEAAYVCSVRWSRTECVAVYAGGVRFYQSLQIGSVVECRARLLHTGRTSLHISVHVRSGDPKTDKLDLATHCLIVFVALDKSRQPKAVPRWEPRSDEDVALEKHARKSEVGSKDTTVSGPTAKQA